ncbi:MBL fold metallo-hydrolase [Eilatimonas milleporae]|uniref:beta-lactamase n=1 Tax=Eilatimonas milleporae TaxID=911205 RepID=A0A3M0BV30_9PROT|nr:MBL fold metallo-hydrolase [Eilatimonas milleporae]RMB01431.1 glyoxylase-like metal-dependent hydrolase (beta-lactamase superfamily II) [Eilatimonas milleporae]
MTAMVRALSRTIRRPTRRSFLAGVGAAAVAGYTARHATALDGVNAAMTGMAPIGRIVDEQPFARLETVGDGIWAAVSTPLKPDGGFGAVDTLCNGGLILGDDHVVAIDAFYRPSGAAWLAGLSEKLTGRRPTHVIVTHLHADHSGGLAGYFHNGAGPDIIMTETTRRLINDRYGSGAQKADTPFTRPPIQVVGPTQILSQETSPVSFDIGGRILTIDPLAGHTPSDLAIHIDNAAVQFAGDLVWQGLFPNYVDAIPSRLKTSVAHLLREPDTLIVTGHGGLAYARDLGSYVRLLDAVEQAARVSFAGGVSAADGAAGFVMPADTAGWHLFNPRYVEIAFTAWYREWETAAGRSFAD